MRHRQTAMESRGHTGYTRRGKTMTHRYTGNHTGGRLARNLNFHLICLVKQPQNEETAY